MQNIISMLVDLTGRVISGVGNILSPFTYAAGNLINSIRNIRF